MNTASSATAAARNPQVDGVCQEWVVALEKPYTPQNSAAHTATGAGQVQPWPPPAGSPPVQQQRPAGHPGGGEEQVDVQAPAPGQVLGQHAAEQQDRKSTRLNSSHL